MCPKNKIASAISHYRQPHQPPSLNHFPLCVPPSLSDKTHLVTSLSPSTQVSLFQTTVHFFPPPLSHSLPFSSLLSRNHIFVSLLALQLSPLNCPSTSSLPRESHRPPGRKKPFSVSFLLQWNWFVTSKSEQKHDICQNAAKLAETHCDRACLTAQLHTDQGGPDGN